MSTLQRVLALTLLHTYNTHTNSNYKGRYFQRWTRIHVQHRYMDMVVCCQAMSDIVFFLRFLKIFKKCTQIKFSLASHSHH